METLNSDQHQSGNEQREAILRYLEACPNAADTLHGVVEWWIPLQRYHDDYDKIAKILEELFAEGLIEKQVLPDKKVIYKAIRKKDSLHK
ncbi:MAG: hypothetical protein B0W54_01595 [Cellvibrio sp. 79]|nr:MAG: hypothetical protein B0W54_01595 [Cellvibrio sp. 79]